MTKKIILLALAAASVAAFALPAMAMAEDIPVHVVPAPTGEKTIDGEGTATLEATFGHIKCSESHGKATFTSSTAGTFEQTFSNCVEPFGGKCTTEGLGLPSGTITTTLLAFDLLTVEDSTTQATGPGVLVTPNGTHFATFKCPLIGEQKVTGNGLVGTIKSPECGKESTEATVEFSSTTTTGQQTHRTVVGTTTEYELKSGGQRASEDASGIITLGTKAKLECT